MKPDKKQQARDLYLHAQLTQTEIANILAIDRKTVYLWIRNGEWDKMRAAARQAPGIVQQDLFNHIDTINQNIFSREDCMPTPQEIEMLRKLTAMTKSMERQHSGSYMQAFQDLCMFIYKKDPNLSRQITVYADNYLKATFRNKKYTTEECEEVMQAAKENEQIEKEQIAQEAKSEQELSNAQPQENTSPAPPIMPPTGNNGENKNDPNNTPNPPTGSTSSQNVNQNNDEKFPKPEDSANGENNTPTNPNPPKKE